MRVFLGPAPELPPSRQLFLAVLLRSHAPAISAHFLQHLADVLGNRKCHKSTVNVALGFLKSDQYGDPAASLRGSWTFPLTCFAKGQSPQKSDRLDKQVAVWRIADHTLADASLSMPEGEIISVTVPKGAPSYWPALWQQRSGPSCRSQTKNKNRAAFISAGVRSLSSDFSSYSAPVARLRPSTNIPRRAALLSLRRICSR